MKSACPGPDLVRETLEFAREALETGRRIEALVKAGDDPHASAAATGMQRDLTSALDAVSAWMELILAARQDGYRQGEQDGEARAEHRLMQALRCPSLRLA